MTTDAGARTGGLILLTLASAQFVMTLDSSVMNVSIATVAADIGTTVTGIQTAITLYTLVMASFMITGGTLGQIWGRKRAFSIGCVIYALGSFTTSLAPNLAVLLIGWSLLEGLGAALILPAIVALVASNFGAPDRPRAYGLVASAAAIAVAAGPLIGGLFTTYLSWRLVFVGEVIVILIVLVVARRTADVPGTPDVTLDLVGTALSAVGLALVVYGVIRSGTWGLVLPMADAPSLLGLSAVVWLVLAGGVVLLGFLEWERHRGSTGKAVLLDPSLLRVRQLRSGLNAFFYQYLLQAGMFFTIPLFLSIALGLSAIETGLRLLPLSISLLIAALGVPKCWPNASPRRVVRIGFALLFVGLLSLIGALEYGAGAEIVTVPLLLAGLGVGALASQLGAVTVSAVADERSGEVGGLQNTFTNLGASIGTALAGAVLIAALASSFLTLVLDDPAIPDNVAAHAETQISENVEFVSDAQLAQALDDAGVAPEVADALVDDNAHARISGLRASLALLALVAMVALATTGRLPRRAVTGGGPEAPAEGSGVG